MRLVNNKVLIRPDGDIASSMEVVGDRRWSVSVTGTVIKLPNIVMDDGFLENSRKTYKRSYPPHILHRMRGAVKSTVEVKPVVELKEGDKVFFSYLIHNRDGAFVDGNIVCHYDSLICKVDPIVPLNGYLLVKMDEAEWWKKDINRYGEATVMFAGPCTEYREGGFDDPNVTVGSRVLFEKNSCVRLEVDVFNTLNDGQSSLFRVRRKNILAHV